MSTVSLNEPLTDASPVSEPLEPTPISKKPKLDTIPQLRKRIICPFCTDAILLKEKVALCEAGHVFHLECLASCMKAVVSSVAGDEDDNSAYGIKCSSHSTKDGRECGAGFPERTRRQGVPDEQLRQRIDSVEAQKLVLAANLKPGERLVPLRFCDSFGIVGLKQKSVKCNTCNKNRCLTCFEIWKSRHVCPHNQREPTPAPANDDGPLTPEDQERQIENKVAALLDSITHRPCPVLDCGNAPTFRISGCNRMKCPKNSKKNWCFECGEILADTSPYKHFCMLPEKTCDHSRCGKCPVSSMRRMKKEALAGAEELIEQGEEIWGKRLEGARKILASFKARGAGAD